MMIYNAEADLCIHEFLNKFWQTKMHLFCCLIFDIVVVVVVTVIIGAIIIVVVVTCKYMNDFKSVNFLISRNRKNIGF